MPNIVPVKYFNDAMTGAPQLTGQVGSEVTLERACLVSGFDSKTVTITQAGGVATVTCNGHGRKVNEVVLHAGANESNYNGEFRVLTAATNTYTVAVDSQLASPATGTITSKVAPAGWSELFAPGQPGNVTNVGVWRPANTYPQNVLQVLDNSPGSSSGMWSRWRGYESMSDAVNGTGLFPIISYIYACNKSSTTNSTARSWDLICDDGMFYFHTAWSASYTTEYELFFFGHPGSTKVGDIYCTIISAATQEGQGAFCQFTNYVLNAPLTISSNLGKSMPRGWAQTGGGILVGLVGDTGISNYSGYGGLAATGNPPDNGLYWSKISVSHDGAIRTVQLPGILQYLHTRNYNHRDLITNIPGQTGKTFIALRANYSSYNAYGMFLYDLTGPWSR
jgi:hypothetical protein